MTIGTLKHRLTLQEKILTADAGGSFTETWVNVTAHPTVFARIDETGGARITALRQNGFAAQVRIIIRHRGNVTPQMRLIGGGKVYTIISVRDPDGTARFLEIAASTGKPAPV